MTFKINSVIQASDGGYVLAGYVPAGNAPQLDWTLKISHNGTVEWNKTYGTVIAQSFANAVVKVSEGYVLAANSKLYGLDKNGSVLWSEPSAVANYLVKTSDGGYLVSSGNGAALTKTDAQGKTQWSKTYKLGSQYSFFQQAIQTADGGYLACGQAYPTYEGVAWIVKVDSKGEQQYVKSAETFSGHNSVANSIIEVSSGVYVLTGSISSISDPDYSEIWLAKVTDSILSAQNSEFSSENLSPTMSVAPLTPTPSVPEFSLPTFLLFAAVLGIFVVAIRRRKQP